MNREYIVYTKQLYFENKIPHFLLSFYLFKKSGTRINLKIEINLYQFRCAR